MGMKTVILTGNDFENVLAGFPNTKGILIQNKTSGSMFVYLDVTKPSKEDECFAIRSGDFFTIEQSDGASCFVKAKGSIVMKN